MIRKNERGITLIALVVTIIVLIILATVSINMVVGENGLIKKAEQARDAYEESSKKEVEGLNSMLEEMMKATGKGPNSKPLVDTLTDIQTSTVDAEDVYGKEVTVPKGFKVKPEYGTKVNDGIVIEDADGNQFVWVPCTEGQYKKHEYHTQTIDDTKEPIEDDGNGNWKTQRYRQYTEWKEDSDVDKNKNSVKNNGGFYVGRFEAGVPEDAPFYASEENDYKYQTNDATNGNNSKNVTKEGEKNLKPVSKQNWQAWNYINQTNAITVSNNMYSGEENAYGVKSSLIDGIAWDRIAEWIASEDEKTSIVTNSKNYGNYANNTTQLTEEVLYAQHVLATPKADGKIDLVLANKYKTGKPKLGEEELIDTEERLKYKPEDYINGDKYNLTSHTLSKWIELSTGADSDFKLKNIYDMAGNMYEWTTENETNEKRAVHRGGSFTKDGDICSISFRDAPKATYLAYDIGFRVVLYIN